MFLDLKYFFSYDQTGDRENSNFYFTIDNFT